jgi:hypothetical protein
MPFHVKTGGVWQESSPKVKVAGVWQDVAKAYVKTGGVWQEVFAAVAITLSGESVSAFTVSSPASSQFRFDNDGKIYEHNGASWTQVDTVDDWVRPTTVAANYEIRYTAVTGTQGTTTNFGTINTWYALTSDRYLSVTTVGAGFQTASRTYTVEIRLAGSGSALATGTYTLTAERAQ